MHMGVKLDLICFSFLLRNEVEELLALAATVALDKVCVCLIVGFFMGCTMLEKQIGWSN